MAKAFVFPSLRAILCRLKGEEERARGNAPGTPDPPRAILFRLKGDEGIAQGNALGEIRPLSAALKGRKAPPLHKGKALKRLKIYAEPVDGIERMIMWEIHEASIVARIESTARPRMRIKLWCEAGSQLSHPMEFPVNASTVEHLAEISSS